MSLWRFGLSAFLLNDVVMMLNFLSRKALHVMRMMFASRRNWEKFKSSCSKQPQWLQDAAQGWSRSMLGGSPCKQDSIMTGYRYKATPPGQNGQRHWVQSSNQIDCLMTPCECVFILRSDVLLAIFLGDLVGLHAVALARALLRQRRLAPPQPPPAGLGLCGRPQAARLLHANEHSVSCSTLRKSPACLPHAMQNSLRHAGHSCSAQRAHHCLQRSLQRSMPLSTTPPKRAAHRGGAVDAEDAGLLARERFPNLAIRL